MPVIKPRELKKKVEALLEERRFNDLAEMMAGKKANLRYLNRLLNEPLDHLLRWRAIEGVGAVADRLAGEDPESVRVILRTLLWTVNEESGGIGWGAPESIAEIICRRPDMFGEFASIVLSMAEEEMLRRGVVRAAGRIAGVRPDLVSEYLPEFEKFLADPDPVVRGYTLQLLGVMGKKPDLELLGRLLADQGRVPVYENGMLKETTVAELAAAIVP